MDALQTLRAGERYYFLDTDYVDVYQDPHEPFIRVVWKGLLTEQQMINGLNGWVGALDHGTSTKVLVDSRNHLGPWQQLIPKLVNDVLVRAAEGGLKMLALTYGPDAFGKFSMDQYLPASRNVGFDQQIFTSLDEAIAWLLSK